VASMAAAHMRNNIMLVLLRLLAAVAAVA